MRGAPQAGGGALVVAGGARAPRHRLEPVREIRVDPVRADDAVPGRAVGITAATASANARVAGLPAAGVAVGGRRRG